MLEFIENFLPLLMFLCLTVLLFSGFPVAFVLGGTAMAFGLIGAKLDLFSLVEFNNIVLRTWGGVAENLLLVAIPMFVFMGVMLERSRVAEDLLMAMQGLLSGMRGGLAIAVTLMGTILAATTGIIAASVVMLGFIALPTMLSRNYQKELAVGTICASGSLGILIPPSIMLVLVGELLSISVGELFMAAVFPGLTLAALYIIYISAISTLKPEVAPMVPASEREVPVGTLLKMVARSLFPPVLLIALVLGSIFMGWATPTEASGIGAFGAILLAAFKGRLNLATLRDVLRRSTNTTSMIFTIFIGATAFSYVFRSLGGDNLVEDILLALPLGAWGVLAVMMGLIFVMGFFFDWIEITLIVLPLFGPIAGQLDFGAHITGGHNVILWFAMLVAINLQTSFLTPPFGFALFYLKGVCPPGITLGHLYRGIVPFVLMQILCMALVVAFPVMVTWLPDRVLK